MPYSEYTHGKTSLQIETEIRDCCFDRAQCTETYVSNNGVLLEPKQKTEARAKRVVK